MRPEIEHGAGIETREEIEALVAYEGRGAGTDAERRAAEHLARRLRAIGREGEVEPVVVRPRFALTHALHALVAVVGSVVSVSSPPVGAALVLVAAISAYGDLTGRLFLFRRLTAKRASQNVVSREGGEKAGVLVLLAHHDAAHTGGVFRPAASSAERGSARASAGPSAWPRSSSSPEQLGRASPRAERAGEVGGGQPG